MPNVGQKYHVIVYVNNCAHTLSGILDLPGNTNCKFQNNSGKQNLTLTYFLRYDLMLGVTKAEAYFAFSGDDVQYGIEADRRSKILKSFVRNTYSYHLSEILATIINEYTDWERPVQHPINIRSVS